MQTFGSVVTAGHSSPTKSRARSRTAYVPPGFSEVMKKNSSPVMMPFLMVLIILNKWFLLGDSGNERKTAGIHWGIEGTCVLVSVRRWRACGVMCNSH